MKGATAALRGGRDLPTIDEEETKGSAPASGWGVLQALEQCSNQAMHHGGYVNREADDSMQMEDKAESAKAK